MTIKKDNLHGRKVLVFGLGLLGGGVATTNWLLKHGAKVTITDIKTKQQLKPSLKKIKKEVGLSLGGHNEQDFKNNDYIVVNPDIPKTSPFLRLAKKLKKNIENEATIFYKFWDKKLIAVTGTRGKTTTANWIGHFLNACFKAVVAGNSYSTPLLSVLDKSAKFDQAVIELPSFLLEMFKPIRRGPDIAVITNIFQDHLNRYSGLKEYISTKANILKNQSPKQRLILNYDNEWTSHFQKMGPKAQLWFFSLKPLKRRIKGVFYKNGKIYFQNNGKFSKVLSIKNFNEKYGEHNLYNLLASSLTAYLAGCPWQAIQQKIPLLPQIPFRQEIIFDNKKVKIINDTTATSPEGGIAALRRFGGGNCILISGGTDCRLDFKKWVKEVRQRINPKNLILLNGSATDEMIKLLGRDLKNFEIYDTLDACLISALKKTQKYSKTTILFSPASKSFEKFKNEYDRGKKFNNLVREKI